MPITITKINPLVSITDGSQGIVISKQAAAGAFDINGSIVEVMGQTFVAALNSFTIDGVSITSISDFDAAITNLTS